MCDEVTKQKFLFLSSFNQVGKLVPLMDLRKRLSDLSKEYFGTDKYINYPEPFYSLIQEELEERDIARENGGDYKLTDFGRANLQECFRPYIEEAPSYTQ